MAQQGLLKHLDRTVGYASERPGCHDCPHWRRDNASTGHCGSGGGHPGWLTSFAYICPTHPADISL
jgi:hypothetical protein